MVQLRRSSQQITKAIPSLEPDWRDRERSQLIEGIAFLVVQEHRHRQQTQHDQTVNESSRHLANCPRDLPVD